jgi:hypothetical protein
MPMMRGRPWRALLWVLAAVVFVAIVVVVILFLEGTI